MKLNTSSNGATLEILPVLVPYGFCVREEALQMNVDLNLTGNIYRQLMRLTTLLVLRCRYLHMVRRVFPPEDAAGFARSRRRYLRLAWALFAMQAALMTATRVAAAKCW